MGEARETLGRLIDALQKTNRLLGAIEEHSATLKGLQQSLQADHQALQEIGFNGLPATFAKAFQEQLGYLDLAGESLAAALNVSYCPKLEAKTKVVGSASSVSYPLRQRTPLLFAKSVLLDTSERAELCHHI